MKLEIARPYILILIPVVVAALIVSMRFMYAANKSRKIFQVVVRSVLISILILALAGVSVKLTSNKTTTIFLVDVSDSVRDQREDVIRFVNEAVKNKGKDDSVGIIAFGSDAMVEQFISPNPVFTEVETDINMTATNLENAVMMAEGMIKGDTAKRIVLITDGCENEGSIINTISGIAALDITVQAHHLEQNSEDEVYVSDVKIPEDIGINEKFNINVEVESNVATQAKVSLYLGRTLKGQQDVMIQKGTNHFIFTDTQTDEGLKTYTVIVEPLNDTVTVNNEYSAYTNIDVKKPVLLVQGKQGQGKEVERILDSIGIKYDTVMPSTVPNDISSMREYSAVVFVDVYEDDLRDGFEDTLKTYIKDYGGGFICTGGNNSFAVGGYGETALEEVLPVSMRLDGQMEIPDMSYCMVIDHSGSMDMWEGQVSNLDLAKEAAIAGVENIRDEDYIGVIAFDDSYDWVVPIQKAGSDRTDIENKIQHIPSGGGTSIYPALARAVEEQEKIDAEVKHIILLTDGEDGYDFRYYQDLIKRINDDGITVSTVSVGGYANSQLLSQIASSCNGRMYVTDVNTDVPRIFAQEVYLSSESYIRNTTFEPQIVSNHKMLTGINSNNVPELYGYVASTPKANAMVLMKSDADYPILSTWQYGLGRSVAWNSDFTGQWSGEWSGTDTTQTLWNNMISYVTDETGIEGTVASVEQSGKTATIHYHTEEFSGDTSVVAMIADDDGNVHEVELDPTSPGEFETSFNMEKTGVYSIDIQQKTGDTVVSHNDTAAILQYSLEYQFMSAQDNLEGFVSSVGGTMINEPGEVFAQDLEMVKEKTDIVLPLLILAALVFLFDIAVRRFHLDPIGSIIHSKSIRENKKRRKEAEKAAAREAALKANMASRAAADANEGFASGSASAPASGSNAPKGKSKSAGPDVPPQEMPKKEKKNKKDKNDKNDKNNKGGSAPRQLLDTDALLNGVRR